MSRTRLHLDDFDHESRVLGAVDALLTRDHNYKLMSAKLLAAQDRLQALCEPDAWIAFMDTEEAVNVRVNLMLLMVARWAFHEGRRSAKGE